MKIKWKRAVSIILVMTLMVTFAQWKVYADEEKETTEIVENNLEVVYQEKEYKIIISLKEHWDSGYNANVKIENIGEETIENWYLQWVYEEDITNIWNAEVKSHQDANYIIKNVTWNQDIESGKSIEFGFSGNKSFTGFPKECKLVGDSSEVKKDDYTIQYQLDSDWGDGFTGRVLITNNTEQTLEDWVLEMDFARQITNIWDGKIKLHEENHYIIQNAGYNSNIMAGQTISFGFNGINGKKEMEPEDITFAPENLAKLIALADKGTINSTVAKEVFEVVFTENTDPEQYVKEHGLGTVSDEGALRETIEKIVEENPQSVADYQAGMQGKANPGMVNQILTEILDRK